MTDGGSSRAKSGGLSEGLVETALVGAGGAFGAVARALAGTLVAGAGGPAWATTALVNLVGAFALGTLVAWLEAFGPQPRLRAFLAIGFLGAFTTFSTLVGEGRSFAHATTPSGVMPAIDVLYLMGSLALGLVSFLGGQGFVVLLLRRRSARRTP